MLLSPFKSFDFHFNDLKVWLNCPSGSREEVKDVKSLQMDGQTDDR